MQSKYFQRLILMLLTLTLLLSSAAPVMAAPKTGWNKKHTIYYVDGHRANGPLTINNRNYYFIKGKPQVGAQTWGNPAKTYYYSRRSGVMLKGFRKIDGKTYYFSKKTGEMKYGWVSSKGHRYYFKKDGSMKTGFLKKGGKYYYFKKNGQMKTGTLKRKGYVYKFSKKGVLLKKYTKEEYAALKAKNSGTKATELKDLTAEEVVEKVGPLFTEDQKDSGVLACISMAQFLLESAYGQSELALKANNCFGMKQSLSGNTWKGSSWNGTSVYAKKTTEEDDNGNLYTIIANFRKYSCIEDSIADHSAYLANAMDDEDLRYEGLKNCRSYIAAAKIILNGGYATDSSYVLKLCSLISKWDLTRFNV